MLLVKSKSFFCLKVSETTTANLVLVPMHFNVRKDLRDVCDWSIVFLSVKFNGNTLVVFTTDHYRMASAAFVIKDRYHIDDHLKLIFDQIDILG